MVENEKVEDEKPAKTLSEDEIALLKNYGLGPYARCEKKYKTGIGAALGRHCAVFGTGTCRLGPCAFTCGRVLYCIAMCLGRGEKRPAESAAVFFVYPQYQHFIGLDTCMGEI